MTEEANKADGGVPGAEPITIRIRDQVRPFGLTQHDALAGLRSSSSVREYLSHRSVTLPRYLCYVFVRRCAIFISLQNCIGLCVLWS